jgi:hypothetical protein
MDGLVGVIPIETRAAGVTVRAVEPETAPSTAVTVTEPALRVVPSPSYPEALLTAATDESDVLQVTVLVRS